MVNLSTTDKIGSKPGNKKYQYICYSRNLRPTIEEPSSIHIPILIDNVYRKKNNGQKIRLHKKTDSKIMDGKYPSIRLIKMSEVMESVNVSVIRIEFPLKCGIKIDMFDKFIDKMTIMELLEDGYYDPEDSDMELDDLIAFPGRMEYNMDSLKELGIIKKSLIPDNVSSLKQLFTTIKVHHNMKNSYQYQSLYPYNRTNTYDSYKRNMNYFEDESNIMNDSYSDIYNKDFFEEDELIENIDEDLTCLPGDNIKKKYYLSKVGKNRWRVFKIRYDKYFKNMIEASFYEFKKKFNSKNIKDVFQGTDGYHDFLQDFKDEYKKCNKLFSVKGVIFDTPKRLYKALKKWKYY